jgi:hypothetical protein
MANTYTLISSVTVGSGGASSIDFTSIPATYTDLLVKFSTRSVNVSGNYDQLSVQFNGSTASNYSARLLYGLGTGTPGSVSSGTVGSMIYTGYSTTANATASTFANAEIYIPNYTSSNAKSVSVDFVSENNATDAIAGLNAGLWSLTNAVTSIKLATVSTFNFAQYSTAYLYGISNA